MLHAQNVQAVLDVLLVRTQIAVIGGLHGLCLHGPCLHGLCLHGLCLHGLCLHGLCLHGLC